jgi:hypothetical protein
MERNRNWLGIAALALAGLALFVALAGRVGPGAGFYRQWPPMAAQAPFGQQFERGPGAMGERFDRELRRELEHGAWRHGEFGPGHHRGFGHGFGPLGLIFGLLRGLVNLAALGLLAWLLLKIFQQRRTPPAAPAAAAPPTTPAGHDPRVE